MEPTPTPETTRTQSEPAELETRDVLLNIGPAHPAMHGIVRIVTKLDGEQIQEAEVEIGYLHRGFEKMAETVDYNGVIPYADRLNYVSPLINNMGYCMAVEKLLGISVPERCHYVRVIVSEISRITDHLTCVGASAMELGALTVFLYMIKAREYLWDLVEQVTGARLTVTYCRVGGVKADLPEDFAEPCRKAFEETRKVLDEVQGLLTRNRIFVERMSGTGVISAEDAISPTGSQAPSFVPPARTTTCARTARTLSTTGCRSTCRWEAAATTWIVIWSAWKRWSSPCASWSKRSATCRPVRSRSTRRQDALSRLPRWWTLPRSGTSRPSPAVAP